MERYGFECEYWVIPEGGGEPILVPRSLPSDDCGFLVEARGEPHTSARVAAFLMLAEEERLKDAALAFAVGKCILTTSEPTRVLTPEFRREAIRVRGKGAYPSERGNIYGRDYKPTDKFARAGLHVHFSNSTEVRWSSSTPSCSACGKITTTEFSREVPQQQDLAKIVRVLDEAFKEEILAARRLPGFYELKSYGFEYRSLPASVSPVAVAKVIEREGL